MKQWKTEAANRSALVNNGELAVIQLSAVLMTAVTCSFAIHGLPEVMKAVRGIPFDYWPIVTSFPATVLAVGAYAWVTRRWLRMDQRFEARKEAAE